MLVALNTRPNRRRPAHLSGAARPTTPKLSWSSVDDFGRARSLRMLARGLAEFPPELIEQALTLLTSGTLYRSEKCVGAATWLLELHRALAAVQSPRRRDALVWRAAATAPAGFAHVRSGMLGTLLEDLANGLDAAALKRRFDEKMDPSQYMRAQVAPTAGNIAQAEKAIAGLKAAGALDRRYARLADVPTFLWRPRDPKPAGPPGSVFGHLTPKAKAPAGKLGLPTQTMTWEKFARTVLPDALAIEAQTPDSPERFMALVTAANADAPPILQWDAEGQRNPMSWYYHAGIDAEIKRRVEGAGGQYEGVDVRASLLWNNRNDLDLHVVTPSGEHVYFGYKRSRCAGWLDVDMNVSGETTTPVENIRWARGTAPRGRYRVYVQNYRFHERDQQPTPFKVEVEIGGEIYHFHDTISPHRQTGSASDVVVFEFDHVPGQPLAHPPRNAAPRPQGTAQWNVAANAWVPVTAVVASPNLWGDRPLVHHGRHTFFLLKGCRDTAAGLGRGFFTETLRSELHSVRATLEAFNRSATIAGADEAEACGLGRFRARSGTSGGTLSPVVISPTMPATLALLTRPWGSPQARGWAALLVALAVLLLGPAPAWAFTPPPIQGHVTDVSGKLTPQDRAALDAKLDGFRRETKKEIAVLLVRSLEGESIEDVAYATFNAWKIGQKGEDNGVLLVIATGNRKIRIETGKGVGGDLTDVQSAEIIREQIAPALKEERFYDGVNAGTDAIATALNGGKAPQGAAPTAPRAKAGAQVDGPGVGSFFLAVLGIVLLIFVYIMVDQYLRRKGHKGLSWGGSGGGGGGSSGGGGGGGGYSGGGGSSGGGGASGSY